MYKTISGSFSFSYKLWTDFFSIILLSISSLTYSFTLISSFNNCIHLSHWGISINSHLWLFKYKSDSSTISNRCSIISFIPGKHFSSLFFLFSIFLFSIFGVSLSILIKNPFLSKKSYIDLYGNSIFSSSNNSLSILGTNSSFLCISKVFW